MLCIALEQVHLKWLSSIYSLLQPFLNEHKTRLLPLKQRGSPLSPKLFWQPRAFKGVVASLRTGSLLPARDLSRLGPECKGGQLQARPLRRARNTLLARKRGGGGRVGSRRRSSTAQESSSDALRSVGEQSSPGFSSGSAIPGL